MDKEKLRQRLFGIFLGEFDRYLETLKADLGGLEREPNGPASTEQIERLHRDSHGLKGAARAAGVPVLQQTFFGLERLMASVREGRRPVDSEVLGLLAAAAEALGEARQKLNAQQDLSGSPLEPLLPRLEAALQAGA